MTSSRIASNLFSTLIHAFRSDRGHFHESIWLRTSCKSSLGVFASLFMSSATCGSCRHAHERLRLRDSLLSNANRTRRWQRPFGSMKDLHQLQPQLGVVKRNVNSLAVKIE